MITKHGVCYDFSISSYRTTLNGITYVFSSKLHLEKFKKGYVENRRKISDSLSKRFNVRVDVTILADIVLYKKIESRGFLLVVKEVNIECPNDIILNGENLTLRKSDV